MATLHSDPRRRIAIVGKAPSSLAMAPYHDDSWQIWTLSDLVLCRQAPRYDVHFELHNHEIIKRERLPYWQWLCNAAHKPLYLRSPSEEIPAALVYPKEEIVGAFGDYFTNTVSWMLALAINMQPAEIGVWGVDMATSDEYRAQRPSCEFFLGVAAGRGIAVTLPAQCDLLKTAGLYGFDDHASAMHAKWKARRKELQERIAVAESQADAANQQVLFLKGALDDNREYWDQWLTRG
jgi:hypothetical protein